MAPPRASSPGRSRRGRPTPGGSVLACGVLWAPPAPPESGVSSAGGVSPGPGRWAGRLLPVGVCAGCVGGPGGGGAAAPGLSTNRRRSRCRARAGLSGSRALGAWPVRGPGSSHWGVSGRAGKARCRPGLRPGESWVIAQRRPRTGVVWGVAYRRARPWPPRRGRRCLGHRPRRSRSPGSSCDAGDPRTCAGRMPATGPLRGDSFWGTRSGPAPGLAAPCRVIGCCRGHPWVAAPWPGAQPQGPGTSVGRWWLPGPASPPPAAAAVGAPRRRPYGSRGSRTRVAGEWRGSGGAGGVPAAECWYQTLRGLGFHLQNYCPTRKLKQRKSKQKIQPNQPEGEREETQRRKGRGGRREQTGQERVCGGRGHRTWEWKKRRKKRQPQGEEEEEEDGESERRGGGSQKPTQQSEKRNEKWSFVSFRVKIAEVSKNYSQASIGQKS